MGNVLVDNLKPGMTLNSDATDMSGRFLMRSGTVLGEVNIRVFKMRGVKEVDVQDTVRSGTPIVNKTKTVAVNQSALTTGKTIKTEFSKEDEDKIKIMRATPFFTPFTDQELPLILKTGTWLRCKAGDMILKEGGAPERSFFVILKGSICIQKRVGVTNMKKSMFCLKRGECFGEMAVITGKPRSADAVAEEETYVLKIDADTLNKDTESFELRSIQFKFYKTFCDILAKRLAYTGAMAVKQF